jgi:hypothetical protein
MGKTIMGAVVSLDCYIADDSDGVGPLFDWYSNGDVSWAFERSVEECRTTRASADFMRARYANVAAVVIGHRLRWSVWRRRHQARSGSATTSGKPPSQEHHELRLEH